MADAAVATDELPNDGTDERERKRDFHRIGDVGKRVHEAHLAKDAKLGAAGKPRQVDDIGIDFAQARSRRSRKSETTRASFLISHLFLASSPSASPESSRSTELKKKRRDETMSRKSYILKAPCHDVLDFLRHYAPMSRAEHAILDYKYVTKSPQDFVMRTQIMNEGWAMYWEKKIMLALFEERAVKGVIDYTRVFSNVCRPRPYFQRNPYHLGYNLWCHIEQLYRDGKVSLDYREETDRDKKNKWQQESDVDPIEAMAHLVDTITDYEFLRRFLTTQLIHDLHLKRIDRDHAERLGIKDGDVVDRDDSWVWLDPGPIKEEMLGFYTHFYRPRIYIIDADYEDGGLLLYHRDDGRSLRKDWIRPTLHNLNLIWKAPVALLTKDQMFAVTGNQYKSEEVKPVVFEQVVERMRRGERPFRPT